MDRRKRRKVATAVLAIMETMESSSSSSSSDESETEEEEEEDENDELVVLYNAAMLGGVRKDPEPIPKLTGYVERIIPGYRDVIFKDYFRMFPRTFELVLGIIGPGLEAIEDRHGRPRMPAKKQLLVALSFMSTPDSYRSVANTFGIGKASAFRIVRRVTYSLHCHAKHFIKWPRCAEAAQAAIDGFAPGKNFPGVIGAIDGTHIHIRAPPEDPESYYNRKKFPSIIMQAVCDASSKFTHCYAGPVGSVHDARVFRNSPVARFLEAPGEYFPRNSHLLGDAAYPLHTHLLTPYRNNGHLSRRQKNFNYCHSSTRLAIERAFGLMKVRFRILLDCLPLTDVKKNPEFIIACCVLHNICQSQNDFFPFIVNENLLIEAEPAPALRNETGEVKQRRIMEELPLVQLQNNQARNRARR